VAKTYQSLVGESRVLLQDTDTDQTRYSDVVLLSILNRGLHDLSRIRPDLTYTAYSGNSLNVPEIVETGAITGQVDWTDTFPWEMWFYNRLIEYLVAVAEISDDEYAVDGRAALMMQLFHNGSIGI
jgi:hypothetical protein